MSPTTAPATAPAVTDLEQVLARLATVPDTLADDADRTAFLRIAEDLKAALSAAQAVVSVDLDTSIRSRRAAAGVPAARQGRGVAAMVAVARRCSPAQGSRHLGLAKALVAELPCTLERMRHGQLSEWRATLIARETAHLAPEHRAVIDRELCGSASTLEGVGDRRVAAMATKRGYELDPHAAVNRTSRAEKDRHCSLRPAPDVMARFSALLPLKQGVALFAALGKAADTARAAGDPRSRAQVMADTLVERGTGLTRADQVPVEVNVVVTDTTLFAPAGTDGAETAAEVSAPGLCPVLVPAGWARHEVAAAVVQARAWLRRVWVDPTGVLTARESRSRTAPAGLAALIDLRDRSCRTPWCDAPIRHRDHVIPWEHGGLTSVENLHGLCEACNYARQGDGAGDVVSRRPWPASSTSGPPLFLRPAPPSPVEITFTRHLLELIA